VKILETSARAAKRAAAAVSAAVSPKPKKRVDPWLSDDERKAEINAAAARDRGDSWLPRRRGWLKGR
jgi:hypothetical protein